MIIVQTTEEMWVLGSGKTLVECLSAFYLILSSSYFREASMIALEKLFTQLIVAQQREGGKSDMALFSAQHSCTFVTKIMQQCLEKIDRVRVTAGSIFMRILHNTSLSPSASNTRDASNSKESKRSNKALTIPNVPHIESLQQIFPRYVLCSAVCE